MILVDRSERVIAVDPAFGRVMEMDVAQLLGASPSAFVGAVAFANVVQPALRRCLGGETVTHQIILLHPALGPRQVSMTYHPCAGADGAAFLCAMILRDVTGEKLANDSERLARELHDSVTQSIYSLTLFAEAGRRLASAGQLERVQEYLTLLGDTAQQAMKQMRLMLYELRPAVLEQVGLVQALTQRLDAVERRAGINARLEVAEPLRLSPFIEESLYRISQEALNNALKHSLASNVVVRLQRDGSFVILEVSDDGIGFILDQPGEAKIDAAGVGLSHIRERATRLNAALVIETAPDQGTKIRVSLQEPEAGATTPWPTTDSVIHYDWTSSHREPVGGDH